MSESATSSPKETVILSAIEARILGVLMEKQLTTPDVYPLTLNALVTGCNQKTSREPVTNYSSGEIEHGVNQLRQRQLVEVEYGSRANRFDQRLARKLFLEKPAQALLTIMLLRGPQTVNELYTRTERMVDLADAAAVEELLTTLCQKTMPIITKIPRQAGQREERYMHLLCGEPDLSQWPALAAARAASSQINDPERVNDLKKVADLEDRVAELERQLVKVIQHLNLDKT